MITYQKQTLLNIRNHRDLGLKVSQNEDLLGNRIQHIKISPKRYLGNLLQKFSYRNVKETVI